MADTVEESRKKYIARIEAGLIVKALRCYRGHRMDELNACGPIKGRHGMRDFQKILLELDLLNSLIITHEYKLEELNSDVGNRIGEFFKTIEAEGSYCDKHE